MMKIVLAASAMLLSTSALAQERPDCAQYKGTTVAPITIQAALAKYPKVAPKGEFETTAAYQGRLATAVAGVGPLIVSKGVEDRKFIVYDADRGVLTILTYAFDNSNANYRDIWGYGGPMYESPITQGENNVDVLFSTTETLTGSYLGTNSFGVKARVSRYSVTDTVVFDHEIRKEYRNGLPITKSIFLDVPDGSTTLDEILLAPADAQKLKATMRIAFVMVPQPPFLVSRTGYPSDATIDSPSERTLTTRVLFADLQCGLAMDASGKVIGAYAIR